MTKADKFVKVEMTLDGNPVVKHLGTFKDEEGRTGFGITDDLGYMTHMWYRDDYVDWKEMVIGTAISDGFAFDIGHKLYCGPHQLAKAMRELGLLPSPSSLVDQGLEIMSKAAAPKYRYKMEYVYSKELRTVPFYALLMAAMYGADTKNAKLLREAFPEVDAELRYRYNAPGGGE